MIIFDNWEIREQWTVTEYAARQMTYLTGKLNGGQTKDGRVCRVAKYCHMNMISPISLFRNVFVVYRTTNFGLHSVLCRALYSYKILAVLNEAYVIVLHFPTIHMATSFNS